MAGHPPYGIRIDHGPSRRSLAVLALLAAVTLSTGALAEPRVVLIGVDGASWSAIDPLIAEGRMPELEKLMKRGFHANLETVEPVISPVVWSSIATGRTPADHGIGNFYVDSRKLEVPTVFERLSVQGLRVGVYDWLVSWPPQELPKGFVIPSWLRRDDRIAPTDAFSRAGVSAYAYSNSGLDSRAAFHESSLAEPREKAKRWNALAKAFEIDAGAVTFYLIDALSHRFWADSYPESFDPTDLEGRGLEPEFAHAVQRGYEAFDLALGEIVSALPEDCTVLLASDHGFQAHDSFQRRWSFELSPSLTEAGLPPTPGDFDLASEFGFAVVRVHPGEFDRQEAFLDRLVTFYSSIRTDRGAPAFNVITLDQAPRPEGRERGFLERAKQWFYRKLAIWLFDVHFDGEAHAYMIMLPEGEALEAAWPNGKIQFEGAKTQPIREVMYGDGFTGDHHPTGVFVAAGPAITQRASRQEVSVLEIAPLYMHLAGGKIPSDFERPLRTEWYEPDWSEQHPARTIQASELPRLAPPKGPDVEDEVLRERLRSMGYVE